MSISWQKNVKPKPAILVLPPDVDSLDEAHAAIEMWEHYSLKTLDSSQRLTVEVMMAESHGRWAARTTGREMPRQNGKGEEFEVVELWGIVQRAEAILHTAHELTTVSSAHQRMVALIERHPDLRRRKRKILNGIGQQLIELTNDGVIAYRTRTNGGGRGLDDISRLVIDEAQHAKPEQLASSTPILLANPNPQMNFAGTGAIAGVSDWWWELRKRALGKSPGTFGYVGHTAETVTLSADGHAIQVPIDPSDRKLWFEANPALHSGRGEIEFFEEQLRTLGAALFAREHLGVWDPDPVGSDGGPITLQRWAELQDDASKVTAAWSAALDVSHDMKWATIAAAGRRSDGQVHVEVVRRQPGTEWIIPYAKAKADELDVTFRIAASGPGGYLIPLFEESDIPVEAVGAQDVTAACSRLISAVTEGTIHHRGGNEIPAALSNATIVQRGDAQAWSRVKSTGDISALVAATIAVGGVTEDSEPRVWI